MIPREYLKRIREIELRTNRMAEEALAGAYHSVFKGRGIDFEEVREYQPGDEVRTIDWNVTARTGRPHVRRYREERELSLVLILDVSASGLFGTGSRSKREIAAEISSVLAFSALKNNDRVALVLVSDTVEKFIPPGKGKTHVFQIIREILFHRPSKQGTSLRQALDFVNGVFTRRAVVFLISDFLDDKYDQSLKITAIRHDVVSIMVYDAGERALPKAGWVTLEDSETGEIVEINTSDPKVRARFEEQVAARMRELQQRMRRANTDLVEIPTSGHYHVTLRNFFNQRATRRH